MNNVLRGYTIESSQRQFYRSLCITSQSVVSGKFHLEVNVLDPVDNCGQGGFDVCEFSISELFSEGKNYRNTPDGRITLDLEVQSPV